MPYVKKTPRRRASQAAMSVLMKDAFDFNALAGSRIHKASTFRALGSTRGHRIGADGRVRLKMKHKVNPRLLQMLDNIVFAHNTNDLIDAAEPVRIEVDNDEVVLATCPVPESRLKSLRFLYWPEEAPPEHRDALNAASDKLPKTWDAQVSPTTLDVMDRKLQVVRGGV